MSFRDLALPLAKLGIPVFPLLPKVKEPPAGMKFLVEATTNPDKIEQWDDDEPNYNCAMLADGESVCFLEFDAGGIEQYCEETGQPRPVTREQKSGKGGQHFIFLADEETRALFNRSVSLREHCFCDKLEHNPHCSLCKEAQPHHHHEWFSFRAKNKYLVAAGSVHPNGRLYECAQDVPPAKMPLALNDWVRSKSLPPKNRPKPKGSTGVAGKFDPWKFWAHYGIEIDFIKDGVWHVVKECPGVGRRHRGSKYTAFYWDGACFGWSCFAQGCPCYGNSGSGMSIGGLIKFLNESHKPFVGAIWEYDEDDDFSDIVEAIDLGFDVKQAEIVPLESAPAAAAPEETAAAAPEPAVEGPKKPRLVLIGKNDTEEEEFALVGVRASDIQPKLLKWLWPEKIPQALTLWTGRPDNGKSLGLIDLAARISRGDAWPDGAENKMGPRIVLYAATEDSKQAVLVPRLIAARANLENIVFPLHGRVREKQAKKEVYDRRINLKNDLKALKDAAEKTPEIAAIILDPMNSYWPDTDENKAKEIAPVLEAIAKFCEDTGVTVIGLIHHRKAGDTDALGKVLGSVRVGGIARAVWEISKDKEKQSSEAGAIRMALVKGNLHRKRTGMSYHLETAQLTIEGESAPVPFVQWDEELDKSADDLMAEEKEQQGQKREGRADACAKWLAERLGSGAVESNVLFDEGQAFRFSRSTLFRAKEQMGIRPFQRGGRWHWQMPGEPKIAEQEVM
jgi:putative DNA primase/helicase